MNVLLLSTYELGRQPFGLASPAAWLRERGYQVRCLDLSRQPLDEDAVRGAELVAVHLPMHTATRLAVPVIERVRRLNPAAKICAYGLYAPLNASRLRALGVGAIVGAEFEEALTELAAEISDDTVAPGGPDGAGGRANPAGDGAGIPRLRFRVPDRSDLPPLSLYAALQAGSSRRVTGYTEASRGCKHLCRHCPIVPVYGGRFRVVPVDIVLADIAAQVERGARHITFGDPDFFNGITHALRVVDRVSARFPGLTYDVTIKVEHLLRHADRLPALVGTGCVLVTSAVESFDDRVLERLAKGHTRADVERAVSACRGVGLMLAPTFVPFTPWTTLDSYVELLEEILRLDLVDQVAPVQLAIRLLVPDGSPLLALDDIRAVVGPFDEAQLAWPWVHRDAHVDELQRQVMALVAARANAPRREAFEAIVRLACERASRPLPRLDAPRIDRAAVPYLNEPWYC